MNSTPDIPSSEETGREPIFRLSLCIFPDKVLRTICQPVETFDSALRDIAEEMLSLMRRHSGIGLAAPQVGLEKRLFVCGIESQFIALANVQVQESAQTGELGEGCLSLPGVAVMVTRPERIRVSGYDIHGKRKSFAATGLWARVIQHELDHLNGVLICDYEHQPEGRESYPLALPATLTEERGNLFHRPGSH